MKILHVITTLDTGGAERLMVDLLPLLNAKGDQAELLLFNGFRTPLRTELEQRGVLVHELFNEEFNYKGSGVYNPMNIKRLSSYFNDYDIIHTHNTACQFYVPLARALLGKKVILVTTEHSSNNRRRDMRWFKPIDRWMYNQYEAVVCISEKAQTSLENYIGKREKVLTINNGVDVKRFLHPIKNVLAQEDFIITMVAGLRAEKDHETVFRALTHMPTNYRLKLVGIGVREAELKALTQEMGIQDRVVFMGLRSDVPDILEQSDVVVLSSHWEGLSLSSVEGMASGRPFIASDVDGLREVVGGAGVLFPHGDDKSLAESIQRLCENPAYYREVAEACQKRAQQYDISLMADSYHKLYQTLLQ